MTELTRSQDVATIHPMEDSDLRAAIAALQSSTAVIEKHTEALKKQRHALNNLVDHNQTEAKARKRTADQRVKKHLSEKQHVDLVVRELVSIERSMVVLIMCRWMSSPRISDLN